MVPRNRNPVDHGDNGGGRRTMEEILLAAAASSSSSSPADEPTTGASSSAKAARPARESKAACLAFAKALRDLALSASLYAAPDTDETDPTSSASAATSVAAAAASSSAAGGETNQLSAWLYDQLSTLPSAHLSTLELAQLVSSACASSGGDDQMQAALFDTLGESERAMELLFDIVPRAKEIGRLVTEESIREVAMERGDLPRTASSASFGQLGGGGAAAGGDIEAERLELLRQEAIEAANEAAFAQAAAGGMAGPGSAHATHSVVRESDRHAQKLAKKAVKRAAMALKAAKDAGAIVDENEINQLVLGGQAQLDYEAEWGQHTAGLDGMSGPEMRQMLMNLAPEGTKEYFQKKTLPSGTEREYGDGYEVVTIPPPRLDPAALPPRIVLADVMPKSHRKAFAGTTSLNPMQSQVFDTAYNTQENILVCAPTGKCFLALVNSFGTYIILPSSRTFSFLFLSLHCLRFPFIAF